MQDILQIGRCTQHEKDRKTIGAGEPKTAFKFQAVLLTMPIATAALKVMR
jgi:hypothetical protein